MSAYRRIADDELLVAVEHAEPLRHVLDCRCEAHVLVGELALALAERIEMVPLDRDVLMRRHEGEIGHPPTAHLHGTAAGEDLLADEGRVFFERRELPPVAARHLRGDLAGEMADFDTRHDEIGEAQPAPGHFLAETIHFGELPVPQDEAELPVEDTEAVRHAVQRRIEAKVLRLQIAFAERLLGDVLMRDDAAETRRVGVGGLDRAVADPFFEDDGGRRAGQLLQSLPVFGVELGRAGAGMVARRDRDLAEFGERHAARQAICGKAVDLGVSPVPENQPLVAIPDRKAIGHAVERCLQKEGVGGTCRVYRRGGSRVWHG